MTVVTPSSTAAVVVYKEQDDCSEWAVNSGPTEHFTPNWTGIYDYIQASPGTTAEVANDTHENVKGYGKLDLLVKHPGEMAKATTL